MSDLLGASAYSTTSMEGYVGVRKGAWTEEEDNLLRKCIEKYGEVKWHQVPVRAGLNRCRKSCRLRWLNYLKPNIKRGEFMEDEVDLILRLHKLLGNRWSLIAGRLPGRTANDVKNYWNTHLRKKTVASKQELKATTSTTQNTQKINVIKPQPRTFSKKTSAWVNAKITMEENSRDHFGHPNLCKASSSTSLDTPDNNEMITWWDRLLDSDQLVQETPNSMGWSEGPTSTMSSFWAEKSPLRTMFAGSTGLDVDQNCLGNHHDIDCDANIWNLLNTGEDNAM